MGYLDYVNILQGTKSVQRFSHGNTLPLTQRPFGMVSFAPQSIGGSSWWFHPDVPSVEGIRLTHQPSPWIGDYGTVLITPQADVIQDVHYFVWSGYRKEECVFRPDYIKMRFLRSESTFELTPTERCAYAKVTFENDFERCISILAVKGNNGFEVRDGRLYGYTDSTNGIDHSENFKMYFVLSPIGDWLDEERVRKVSENENDTCIHLMAKKDAKVLEFVIGTSYISYEQAELNLKEAEFESFDEAKAESEKAWEEYLSMFEIESDEDTLRTFYSCLYRTGLFPRKAFEVNADGEEVHYSPSTGAVCKGKRYTDNGFWDTYRTEFPLLSLIKPELYRDVMESVLYDYKESGFLPRWISIGEVGCMPSTLIDSVIAQAAEKGICDESLLKELLCAMKHHANVKSEDSRYGRTGIEEYLKYGYVPYDKCGESVNLTLDFAYGDYCIARVAKALGDDATEKEYMQRAKNYLNVFDKETGFMRPKHSDGTFKAEFDPYIWGGDYTEACAYQTTFAVQHDLDGLAEAFGSEERMLGLLDDIFSLKPRYRVGGYGFEIHEITEMSTADFGLCAISNQPSFLLPYIYAYFGKTEKSEMWVKTLCDKAFSYKDDGFPGDEDNGTTGAWYVLSKLGIYPVCPADDRWVSIAPSVKGKVCGMDIEEWKKKAGKIVNN